MTYQYQNIDAIAAELPSNALTQLRDLVGTGAISKDAIVDVPGSVDTLRGRRLPGAADDAEHFFDRVEELSADGLSALAAANPKAYLLNNAIANVAPLHASGITGQGVIVAVIDSGIRPGFPHISLDGSVIGCEDFVGDALGCSNIGNNCHGTFVAGMISANVNLRSLRPCAPQRGARRVSSVLRESADEHADPDDRHGAAVEHLRIAGVRSDRRVAHFAHTRRHRTRHRAARAVQRQPGRSEHHRRQHEPRRLDGVRRAATCSIRWSTHFWMHDIVPVVAAAGNAGPASLTMGSSGDR